MSTFLCEIKEVAKLKSNRNVGLFL